MAWVDPMPATMLSQKWVIAGVLGIVGLAVWGVLSGMHAQQAQGIHVPYQAPLGRHADLTRFMSEKEEKPDPVIAALPPEKPVVPVAPIQTKPVQPVSVPPPPPKPLAPLRKKRASVVLIEEEKTPEVGGEQYAKNEFVLNQQVYPLPSPFTVLAGNIISAVLITGINSDLPGTITAQVTANIYDSVTQSILLIPQASKLLGLYRHDVVEGEERVLVVWYRLIFPNGSSLPLGEMAGIDAEGYSGFHDQVDKHFMEIFGKALVLSAISAGVGIAENGTSGRTYSDSYNSPAQNASASLGREMGRTANEVVRRGITRPPTLKIRPGYLCHVMVEKDLVFTQPYPQ